MSRPLPSRLDIIQTSEERKPDWQLIVYDIGAGNITVSQVVQNQVPLSNDDARDFTAEVEFVDVDEQRGNFVTSGVQASKVLFQVVDRDDVFDPLDNVLVPTDDNRWFREGNVVRLLEGDEREPVSTWPKTFTGLLVGQAGKEFARTDPPQASLTMRALSREHTFLKYNVTSQLFPPGTSYKEMATDIAQNDMGLDAGEINFGTFGTEVSNIEQQFVEQPPLVSIAQLLFVSGFVPRFDGEGRLSQIQATTAGPSARVYLDLGNFERISRPQSDVTGPNVVLVKGLADVLSLQPHPRQVVATAEITTGFFTQDEDFDVYFSEDRRILVRNVSFKIRKSVNGGLRFVGDEDSSAIFAPTGALDPGEIGRTITISTGFAPWLLGFFTAIYISQAIQPDAAPQAPAGVLPTISIGRVVQSIALAGAMLVVMQIGRGVYEFRGDPFEYVYAEITGEARRAGVGEFDENVFEIENHLINSQTLANERARDILFLFLGEGNPRGVEMLFDLKLEPNDIFEIPGNRRFLIDAIKRRLVREGQGMASYQAFEVTSGVVP